MQRVVAAPYAGFSPDAPKTAEAWKAAVAAVNARAAVDLEKLKQDLDVTIERTVVAGVKAFVLTPKTIPEKNRGRLVVALHGGGYVFYPGEPGTGEGVMIAGFGGFKVLAVDYRMPPDFPFPAALDDAIAVWKEVVRTTKPENVALIGTSAGGGLVLATVLRAKAEGLPLPGAVAAGAPWSDLAKVGDSYFTNAWIDNTLVNYDPSLAAMARLYAGGQDLKNSLPVADLWRFFRLPADHSDHRHARSLPVQHGAGPSRPETRRRDRRPRRLRRREPRPVSRRPGRPRVSRSLRRHRRVLRPAPGEMTRA